MEQLRATPWDAGEVKVGVVVASGLLVLSMMLAPIAMVVMPAMAAGAIVTDPLGIIFGFLTGTSPVKTAQQITKQNEEFSQLTLDEKDWGLTSLPASQEPLFLTAGKDASIPVPGFVALWVYGLPSQAMIAADFLSYEGCPPAVSGACRSQYSWPDYPGVPVKPCTQVPVGGTASGKNTTSSGKPKTKPGPCCIPDTETPPAQCLAHPSATNPVDDVFLAARIAGNLYSANGIGLADNAVATIGSLQSGKDLMESHYHPQHPYRDYYAVPVRHWIAHHIPTLAGVLCLAYELGGNKATKACTGFLHDMGGYTNDFGCEASTCNPQTPITPFSYSIYVDIAAITEQLPYELKAASIAAGGIVLGGSGETSVAAVDIVAANAANIQYPGCGLTPELLLAQQNMESGFQFNVVSSAGALGLAQFEPGTWPSYDTPPPPGISSKKDSPENPIAAAWAEARYLCSNKSGKKDNGFFDALIVYNCGNIGSVCQQASTHYATTIWGERDYWTGDVTTAQGELVSSTGSGA